jgi:hypothetical protein
VADVGARAAGHRHRAVDEQDRLVNVVGNADGAAMSLTLIDPNLSRSFSGEGASRLVLLVIRRLIPSPVLWPGASPERLQRGGPTKTPHTEVRTHVPPC